MLLLGGFGLTAAGHASAADALIAVASNYAGPARALAAEFTAGSGHTIEFSIGSTGKLYAQIRNGAPYDALLAADQARPAALEQDGIAITGSRFTFTTGRLLLWSRDASRLTGDGAAVLRAGDFRRLAIANPELAPYGAAAREVLQNLSLWTELQDRLVRGENISQAYTMIASGNAELGFIATSQQPAGGSAWLVPETLHTPVRQDAVLLAHGADNAAAVAFLAFLAERIGDAGSP